MNKDFKDLKVYQHAYKFALDIYEISKTFPKDELTSLTNPIRKASRTICADIAEGYKKRIFPKHFITKMTDSDGECGQTMVWLDFAKEYSYISADTHLRLYKHCEEISKMLGSVIGNADKLIPKAPGQEGY